MQRKNIEKCRQLRNKQTDAERKLWSKLRDRRLCGTKFRRQFPVENYILDFYSPECSLAIEVDGAGHYTEGKQKSDILRDGILSELHIEVLRFNNLEVLQNIEGVLEVIMTTSEKRKSASPSP